MYDSKKKKLIKSGESQYVYKENKLVKILEFEPKCYEPVNYDPTYEKGVTLKFEINYKYTSKENGICEVMRITHDLEDDTTETEYFGFDKFDDLVYHTNISSIGNETTHKKVIDYKYDKNDNWIYKAETKTHFNFRSQKKEIVETERLIKYRK